MVLRLLGRRSIRISHGGLLQRLSSIRGNSCVTVVDETGSVRQTVLCGGIVKNLLLDVFLDLLVGFRLESSKLRRDNTLMVAIKYVKHALLIRNLV